MSLLRLAFSLLLSAQPLPGNIYSYIPLVPPRPQDVVAFSNGLRPSTGIRLNRTKEEILKFLSAGTRIDDPKKWWALEHDQPDAHVDGATVCDGVFTDKAGKFYFWTQHSPHVLKIETPEGATALYVMEE